MTNWNEKLNDLLDPDIDVMGDLSEWETKFVYAFKKLQDRGGWEPSEVTVKGLRKIWEKVFP